MNPTLITIIGISSIFLATSLGSSVVFFFRNKKISDNVNHIFLGFAAGIMLAASIFSLIIPALNDKVTTYMPLWFVVGISVIVGALFIYGIDKLTPHIHNKTEEEGIHTNRISKTSKMFLAVTIHNIPEGLSVGIAYGVALASWTENKDAALMGALMLAIGMCIQNVPEGAAVSLGMQTETSSTGRSFWFGVASGAVEPVAALLGLFLVMQLQYLMPWALAFAAGCMLYVIAEDMVPEMKGNSTNHFGVWSFLLGFVLMMVLDVALG